MPPSPRETTTRARAPRPIRQLEDRCTESSSRVDGADPAVGRARIQVSTSASWMLRTKNPSPYLYGSTRSAATETAMAADTLGRGSSSAAGAAMAACPVVCGMGAAAAPITAGHGNGGLLHDTVDEMSMSPSPYAAVKRESTSRSPCSHAGAPAAQRTSVANEGTTPSRRPTECRSCLPGKQQCLKKFRFLCLA